MARAPYQVLVLPYYILGEEVVYCVFKRRNGEFWQFISGGGEDIEIPLAAAKREAREEAAIQDGEWLCLDSKASIPRTYFTETRHWNPEIFVIPEHSFAVRMQSRDIILSDEHTGMQWVSESEANGRLRFDSNRVALWELAERLRTG